SRPSPGELFRAITGNCPVVNKSGRHFRSNKFEVGRLWAADKRLERMFPQQPSEWRPDQPSGWRPDAASQPPARRKVARRGVAATIVSVAIFGVLIGVAADRWAVTNYGNFGPNPLGSLVPTITTGPRVGPVAAPNGPTAQQQPSTTLSSDP